MNAERTVIRDFIYVDAERLYSVYSQVFEGVADQIVTSYMDGLRSQETAKGLPLSGSEIEHETCEGQNRTESRVLYDHLYNRLEEKLGEVILSDPDVTPANYREQLTGTFMVKVTGEAVIEDYERYRMFTEKFNTIGEAIAYASWSSDEVKAVIAKVETDARQMPEGPDKVLAKQKMKVFKDVKEYAKSLGLTQDETALANLRMFAEVFNPDGYEITITPAASDGSVVFRVIVDRRWLRIRPDLLRSLYGVSAGSQWTVVGQVTYLPRRNRAMPAVTDQGVAVSDRVDDDVPSLRDPVRAVMASTGIFEEMFLESQQRVEVLVCPLAVYRETILPMSRIAPEQK